MSQLLMLSNLYIYLEEREKPIVKGLNLQVGKGEVHVIMGPNGAGKSTLARGLCGDEKYRVEGEALLEESDLVEMEPQERAQAGLFVGFQYPIEIPGLSNEEFLFHAYNSKRKYLKQAPISREVFREILQEKREALGMRGEFDRRGVNEGFSGGEKKRNEILQLLMLEPKVAILDETDSGLDIDAIQAVSKGIKQFINEERGVILITHYERLLSYIPPDYVHVMLDGAIVRSGGIELARELEEKGYATIQGRSDAIS